MTERPIQSSGSKEKLAVGTEIGELLRPLGYSPLRATRTTEEFRLELVKRTDKRRALLRFHLIAHIDLPTFRYQVSLHYDEKKHEGRVKREFMTLSSEEKARLISQLQASTESTGRQVLLDGLKDDLLFGMSNHINSFEDTRGYNWDAKLMSHAKQRTQRGRKRRRLNGKFSFDDFND